MTDSTQNQKPENHLQPWQDEIDISLCPNAKDLKVMRDVSQLIDIKSQASYDTSEPQLRKGYIFSFRTTSFNKAVGKIAPKICTARLCEHANFDRASLLKENICF